MSGLRVKKWQLLLRKQWQAITTFNSSDRRWQLPFTAALASGLPMLLAAMLGHIEFGLAAALGGMVFLHINKSPLSQRMVRLMVCAFGMIACYTVGVFSQFIPLIVIPIIIVTTIVVAMIMRFYDLGPPGALFFVMALSIGAYTPIPFDKAPGMIGLLSLGCIFAVLLAFLYSLYILRVEPAQVLASQPALSYNYIIYEPVVIGVSVGASLLLAHLLQMERAYWVPISCVAVIQGASLQAVWVRQLLRIIGTGLGVWLAFAIFSLPITPITVALLIMLLTFLVEILVVRHYGIAAVFFTPLTLLLAESANINAGGNVNDIAWARFYDTLLGCAIGLVGALCIYQKNLRGRLMPLLQKLIPDYFALPNPAQASPNTAPAPPAK